MAQNRIPYPDGEDFDVCPADDGDHQYDSGTLMEAAGYDIRAEGGIIVRLKCAKCLNVGNYKIPLDDISW